MANRGLIKLIIGPMYSGKTNELLRLIRRYRIAKKNCLLIKSTLDDRYNNGDLIVAHNNLQENAVKCSNLQQILEEASAYDVIGIDQAQFFDDISQVCEQLASSGKVVITAGLSSTFERKSFEGIARLLPLADEIIHLRAICTLCGSDASFTMRTSGQKEVMVVGGCGSYKAVCRECYNISVKSPA